MKDKAIAHEINLDGIVGPTHNYSGLSYGNVASTLNQYSFSNPREAALQGLEKMKFLADMGLMQAIMPPQERPHLPSLRQLGFTGNDEEVLKAAQKQTPELLIAASSAAAMWTANAATVCPSMDSADNLVHITPANLVSKFHRSIESSLTKKILEKIFHHPRYFIHHSPLPGNAFADEGAANQTRFCKSYGEKGVHLFVFGKCSFHSNPYAPQIYPARQTFEASQAIARLHRIPPQQVVFAQQHPKAIDSGAFHNDVVSVGNRNVFFFHEQAFVDKERVLGEIQEKVAATCKCDMIFIEVNSKDITLETAIETYLFNSQLVTLPQGEMALIAPIECQENKEVHAYLKKIIQRRDSPIKHLHFLNLRQSMRNGGGPACLRLRIVLNESQLNAMNPTIFLNDNLYKQLTHWIKKHYRDQLHPKDLADPKLIVEMHNALDELTGILKLGPIYEFQKG